MRMPHWTTTHSCLEPISLLLYDTAVGFGAPTSLLNLGPSQHRYAANVWQLNAHVVYLAIVIRHTLVWQATKFAVSLATVHGIDRRQSFHDGRSNQIKFNCFSSLYS